MITPSIDVTQSGVATIAFEFCVPVIATNTGGLYEQMFDGKVGLFVEPSDVDALAKAMEQFIYNKGLYEEESKKMSVYKEQLDWTVITKQMMKDIMK